MMPLLQMAPVLFSFLSLIVYNVANSHLDLELYLKFLIKARVGKWINTSCKATINLTNICRKLQFVFFYGGIEEFWYNSSQIMMKLIREVRQK
jgi:hypothetical protein